MDLYDFLSIDFFIQVYFNANLWISGVFIGGNLNTTDSYILFMAVSLLFFGLLAFVAFLVDAILLFFGLVAFAAFLIDAIYKEFNSKDKSQ